MTEPAALLRALAARADGKIVAVFTGTVFITEDAHEAPVPGRVSFEICCAESTKQA